MSLRLAALPALVLSFAVAGCGTKTIDEGKAESEIAKGVQQQIPGVRDVKVECPDDIEAKKGDTFDCKLTAAGGQNATVNVTQQDDDGNVRWRLAAPRSP